MSESQPPPIPSPSGEAAVAGFWRRFLACVIDGAIFSIPTLCLGFVFFAQFARLGGWGRLVGFVIALMYFGFMNSAVGNGRTFGKRILKIRLVGLNGSTISVPRSFVRYVILVFGVGGSIIYLIVFNRRNRRSLHDLLASTYVMKVDAKATVPPNLKIWFGHGLIISVVVIIMIGCSFALKGFAERWGL